MQNKNIEQVMFRYLVVKVTSTRELYAENKRQCLKAAIISGALRDDIWKNKYMSTKAKTRIYKTCVKPIMTYAVETRADNVRTK